MSIAANDIKTRGVAAFKEALARDSEAVISVRGKPRYVVMNIEHYEELREGQIFSAWQQARAQVAGGDYVSETAETHIARLTDPSAG